MFNFTCLRLHLVATEFVFQDHSQSFIPNDERCQVLQSKNSYALASKVLGYFGPQLAF